MSKELMDFGSGVQIAAPPGCARIPQELWPDLASAVLLDPAPALQAEWVRGIETSLARHDAANRERIRARRASLGLRDRLPVGDRPWSILLVAPMMERKVAEALTEAGLSCHVPLERYRPANHWRVRTRPLLPGYVFAELRNDDELDLARANHAVREVMCRDGAPIPVPRLLIGTMVLFEAWRAFDRTYKPRRPGRIRSVRRGKRVVEIETVFEVGEAVRVTDGAFSGFDGTVTREHDNRIEVLVSIFGRAVRTDLALDAVEPLNR